MGENIAALRRLQEIEQQILTLRKKEERLKKQVRTQQRNIEKNVEQIQHCERELRSHQMEIDRIDLDVKTRESMLAKHREALSKAKTNKEYATILTTINTEKVDSAKLEARELELMNGIDLIRAKIETLNSQQNTIEEKKNECEKKLEDYTTSIADKLNGLLVDREGAAADVHPTTLDTFTRAAERHDGEALACVERLHPRRDDYVCEGCNMKVTLEVINRLSSVDEIQICSSCGRILYYDL